MSRFAAIALLAGRALTPAALAAVALAAGCTHGLDAPATVGVTVPNDKAPLTFTMGSSPDAAKACGMCGGDRIPRTVQITKPYTIDPTVVTQSQYARCVAGGRRSASDTDPSYSPCASDDDIAAAPDPSVRDTPAVVSLEAAAGYCDSLGLRLPTEAEWEGAAVFGAFTDFAKLSVKEWVIDDWTPAPGCRAQTPDAWFCGALDAAANCGRCAMGGCDQACDNVLGMSADGSFCAPSDVEIDPFHVTTPHQPIQKGGSVCGTDAGFRVAATAKAAFRCVSKSTAYTSRDTPIPTLTVRWSIAPVDCSQRITIMVDAPIVPSVAPLGVAIETPLGHAAATDPSSPYTIDFPCGLATPSGTQPAILVLTNVPDEKITVTMVPGSSCSIDLTDGEPIFDPTMGVSQLPHC